MHGTGGLDNRAITNVTEGIKLCRAVLSIYYAVVSLMGRVHDNSHAKS